MGSMGELELHEINEDSGQITIPKHIRDEFDTDTFHIYLDQGQNCIVLKSVRVKVDDSGQGVNDE